ncbi:MAG TPA: hypothetical protein VHR66_13595, partial [Gemmataceae bacterium]|nr:hypothetical protein [Gemmataceae bacterium]
SLINCFTRLHVGKFPSSKKEIAVFAALTGGFGEVKKRVMVSRVLDNQIQYLQDFPVHFLDRVDEARLVVRVRGLVFSEPGQYAVELLADGEWIAQTVLTVIQ